MRFHDPKYFNDFCAHPLHLFSLVGIFYPPNWQCPSCHDALSVSVSVSVCPCLCAGVWPNFLRNNLIVKVGKQERYFNLQSSFISKSAN